MSERHVLTIFAVRDPKAAASFYTSTFRWEICVDTPVYIELALPGGMRLGLYERTAFGKNTGRVPTPIFDGELAPTELYLFADDVEDAVRRLTESGARELSPLAPRPWGDEAAYFADPDGNVVVVARRISGGPP